MESSFATVLPQLGIGALSVCALVYVIRLFIGELKEREIAFRALEKEVRQTIMEQLAHNTITMERIITHLDMPHSPHRK